MRRLHESLPGLYGDWRPCLWRGLSGAHGRRADAGAGRDRGDAPPAERLDLLRALRGGLPGAHPLAGPDAPLARARIRAPADPCRAALWPRLLALSGRAPARLCAGRPHRHKRNAAAGAPRPHSLAAFRAGQDAPSRHAFAGRGHVPGEMGPDEKEPGGMNGTIMRREVPSARPVSPASPVSVLPDTDVFCGGTDALPAERSWQPVPLARSTQTGAS